MKASTTPTLKCTPRVLLGDVASWVAEIVGPASNRTAFAVVLDLSDSCPAFTHELGKLGALAKTLPRDTPLWIYRLSSTQPLNANASTVAHWSDGTIDFARWCDDYSLRAISSRQGSLLRPVLESIATRRRSEGIEAVKIIVATDGQLLDFAELALPAEFDLRGLTTSAAAKQPQHWQIGRAHV